MIYLYMVYIYAQYKEKYESKDIQIRNKSKLFTEMREDFR